MAKERKAGELAGNRKATYNYEILDTYEAGISLLGTEVKSLRDHGGNLLDSYVSDKGNELWLLNCSIAPFRFGNIHNHEERRERKLLMHKREIAQLKEAINEQGLTLIPLSLYLKEGRVKVKLALAKGKRTIDKRESIKERDVKRRMDKALKSYQK